MGLTSTDYQVTITATDGTAASLTIHINHLNPLPGSDSWKAATSDFGTAGGTVSGWNTGDAHLSGPAGVNSIVLDGFTQATATNDRGKGSKSYDGGSFPMANFVWLCTSKS